MLLSHPLSKHDYCCYQLLRLFPLTSLTPILPPFYRVHPPKRASSSCVYSQCAVHIAVGPCAKGHFIHTGLPDPEFFFLFFWKSIELMLWLLKVTACKTAS
jgi:hypothetical protein